MGEASNIPYTINENNIIFDTPLPSGTKVVVESGDGIIVSSLETLDKYETVTLQQLSDDFGTVAEWVSVKFHQHLMTEHWIFLKHMKT